MTEAKLGQLSQVRMITRKRHFNLASWFDLGSCYHVKDGARSSTTNSSSSLAFRLQAPTGRSEDDALVDADGGRRKGCCSASSAVMRSAGFSFRQRSSKS